MKKHLIFLGLLLIVISSCQVKSTEKGFLEGKISIGPICPVERVPPDPQCQPTKETFEAYQVAVWNSNKKTIVDKLNPDLNGNFKAELNTGRYVVDFENGQSRLRQGKSLPANVLIEKDKITKLDIDIDTGIR